MSYQEIVPQIVVLKFITEETLKEEIILSTKRIKPVR